METPDEETLGRGTLVGSSMSLAKTLASLVLAVIRFPILVLLRIRPNIFLAIFLIGALGLIVSFIGFKMSTNDAIIAAAGIGAIVAITNLAILILEGDFGSSDDDESIRDSWDTVKKRFRPNVMLAMVMISSLGLIISFFGLIWEDIPTDNTDSGSPTPDGQDTDNSGNDTGLKTISDIIVGIRSFLRIDFVEQSPGNEAIVAAAGVGAIIAVSNLAGKILEKEFSSKAQLDKDVKMRKFRPNIFIAMIMMGVLGVGVSFIGYMITQEGLVMAGGIGAIVAITNVAGKIMGSEDKPNEDE